MPDALIFKMEDCLFDGAFSMKSKDARPHFIGVKTDNNWIFQYILFDSEQLEKGIKLGS